VTHRSPPEKRPTPLHEIQIEGMDAQDKGDNTPWLAE
jgi:hypothetical protein